MSRIPAPAATFAKLVSRTQPDTLETSSMSVIRTILAISGRACAWALALALFFSASALAQTIPTNFGIVALGNTSQFPISVASVTGGAVGNVEVLTQGQPNLDFQVGTGANCTTMPANGSCNFSVAFAPLAPGLRIGAVVVFDTNTPAQVLGTTLISGIGQGGLGVLVAGSMTTLAGDGFYRDAVRDGIAATSAELWVPSSVALDGVGNLYIADTNHNRIRLVDAKTGIISTVAGGKTPGYTGDGGLATKATLFLPGGVAVDGAGNIYIADSYNHVIREISAATGIITTVVGNGTQGNTGNGVPAMTASLNSPQGITVDQSGNLWIADTGNNLVREVTVADGMIKTVAGTGTAAWKGDGGPATAAQLNAPFAIAFDLAGNWYIPDSNNLRVRKVDTAGIITTIAGDGNASGAGDGFAAIKAGLFAPSGLAIDPAGNIYITAASSSTASRIRKVSASTGIISTIAVNVASKYYAANLYGPIGITIDGSGNLFFADSLDMEVKEIQSNQVLLDFTGTAVRQGDVSTLTLTQPVENDGNGPLDLISILPVATTSGINTQVDSTVTTCATTTPLNINDNCVVGVQFAPAKKPALPNNTIEWGDVDVADEASSALAAGVLPPLPLAIQAVGNASPLNSTTIAFVNPVAGIHFDDPLTLNVAISASGTVAGTVTFKDISQSPAVDLWPGGVTVTASGTASLVLTGALSAARLAVGMHGIQACFAPAASDTTHTESCTNDDPLNPGGFLAPLPLTVDELTKVTLTSDTASPSAPGGNITFTAVVATKQGGGIPTSGDVVFMDGATPLNATPFVLPTTGPTAFTASLQVPLSNGAHTITAVYTPDAVAAAQLVLSSVSNNLTQNVLTASTVTLSSSNTSPVYGSPVTFTITVTPVPTGPAKSEVVNILVGGANPQSATAGAAGAWTYTTSALAVGSNVITASYSGDANQASGSSPAVTETVTAAPTVTQITAPASAVAGMPVSLKATVTASAPSAAMPVGTVTFTSGGITLGAGPVTLVNGVATISPTLPASATPYSIVATYTPTPTAGVTDFAGSSSTASLAVPFLTPTVQLTLPTNSPTVKTDVQFIVTVTGGGPNPTGNVKLVDNTDSTSSSATALGLGPVTIDWPGGFATAKTYSLTAVYSGDANYSPFTTAPSSLVVVPIATQTTLGVASTGGANQQPIVVASVSSLNPAFPAAISVGNVTFKSQSGAVLDTVPVSSGFATLPSAFLDSSVTSVSANYDGGDQTLYAASQAAPIPVTDTSSDFLMKLSAQTLSLTPSQNGNITVTLTPLNGFNEFMAFGCAGLPAGVTCTFTNTANGSSASSQQFSGTSPMVVSLNIDTNNPLSGGATASNAHSEGSRTVLAAIFWPFSLFFGVLLWRFRKRYAVVATSLLILLLGGATMIVTGCGGVTQSSAKAGTYQIQIVAAGYSTTSSTSSNISHSQTLALTIQ